MDLDIPVLLESVCKGGADALSALNAIEAVGETAEGSLSLVSHGQVLPTLSALLASGTPAEIEEVAAALSSLSIHAPESVARETGALLATLLPKGFLPVAQTLSNLCAVEAVGIQLFTTTPLVKQLVRALELPPTDYHTSLVQLALNMSLVPTGAALLYRAGAMPLLVSALEEERTFDAAASALLEMCGACGDASGNVCGMLLSRRPAAVVALCASAALAGSQRPAVTAEEEEEEEDGEEEAEEEVEEDEEDEGEEEGEGEDALSLLQALILDGVFLDPCSLLLGEGSEAVAALLSLGASPEGKSLAATCARIWGDPERGVAILAHPSPSDRLACTASAAVLAPHLGVVAALLGERLEDVRHLLEVHSSGRAAPIPLNAAVQALKGILPGFTSSGSGSSGSGSSGSGSVSGSGSGGGGRRVSQRAKRPSEESVLAEAREICEALLTRVKGCVHSSGVCEEWERGVGDGDTELVHTAPSQVSQTGTLTVRGSGQWRVLLFDATEQGVTYIDKATGRADPRVLGLEYIRTMAAAGAGFSSSLLLLPSLLPWQQQGQGQGQGQDQQFRHRALAIGLGTGALLAHFTHHFPASTLECLEIDRAVTEVVRGALGVQVVEIVGENAEQRLQPGVVNVRHCDAGEWMGRGVKGGGGEGENYTLVFMDPYEKQGAIPPHLTTPDFLGRVVGGLCVGGAVVVNVWNGSKASPRRLVMEQFCRDLMGVLGVGGKVCTIKVKGQQSNVVVCGIKGGGGKEGGGEGGLASRMTKGKVIAAARTAGAEWLFDPGALLEEVFWVGGGAQTHPSLPEHSWSLLAAPHTSAVDLTLFSKS